VLNRVGRREEGGGKPSVYCKILKKLEKCIKLFNFSFLYTLNEMEWLNFYMTK
jgi:hypothetical protein